MKRKHGLPLTERLRIGSVDGEGGCRLWARAKFQSGHGKIKVAGRAARVHRLAYELAEGRPIPAGLAVCHRCDTPNCVNPGHLFLGTIADNNADMVAKGRQAKGARNAQAKLTPDLVVAMRADHASGMPITKAADKYQASFATAYSAIRCKTWRHVPEHRAPGASCGFMGIEDD